MFCFDIWRFPMDMKKKRILVRVQDMHGNPMPQTCSVTKARAMIAKGEAVLVEETPFTIRLTKPWSPKGMFYR